MHVAILGGTGAFGTGLARRLASASEHTLHVGSRSAERARSAAASCCEDLDDTTVHGDTNAAVCAMADLAVLSIPPYHVADALGDLRAALDSETVLLTPAVGMRSDEAGWHFDPPPAGSVTELVAASAPADCPVVGGLHAVPAAALADLRTDLSVHVPLAGDDDHAKATVASVLGSIDGIEPLDAGPLSNAEGVERLTPLLLNLARFSDRENLSVSFPAFPT